MVGHARHLQSKKVGDIIYLNSDTVTVILENGSRVTWSRFLVELLEYGEYKENDEKYVMGKVIESRGSLV